MLPMKAGLPSQALRLVPYLAPEEIKQLCSGCQGRHRERNALLILLLFQTGLRVSEALTLTVGHLNRQPGVLEVLGKGGKVRLVACPPPSATASRPTPSTGAWARTTGSSRLGRKRAWQIIGAAPLPPGRPV